MKCDRCNKKAVASLRYFNRKLCKDHFINLTEKRIKKTIGKNKLIQRGDTVAVGVSGGKDSISLLHYLHEFRKYLPFELYGVIVDEGIKGYRDDSIALAKKNFEELDIDYKIISFKEGIGKSLDKISKKTERNPCYYCGVFRRNLLNKGAQEWKAKKLATGHNLDDEAQSALMNYLRGDFARMARVGPATPEKVGFVQRIKPLHDIPEKEVGLYAILKGYEIHDDECPYAQESYRWSIRDRLNELEEQHPGTKFALMKGVDELNPILKNNYKALKIVNCKECKSPSPSEVCKFCELLKELD